MLSGTRRRFDFVANGWSNRDSNHNKAVPAGASGTLLRKPSSNGTINS